MYINIDDRKIKLPKEYNLEQRLEFVEQLLETYPNEFEFKEKMFDIKFGKTIDTNIFVKKRLEVLATYIIKCEEDYKETIMSTYKEHARPKQEIPFSCTRGKTLYALKEKGLIPSLYDRWEF